MIGMERKWTREYWKFKSHFVAVGLFLGPTTMAYGRMIVSGYTKKDAGSEDDDDDDEGEPFVKTNGSSFA